MAKFCTPQPVVPWECCQCNREVATGGDNCPDCSHTKCVDCKPPTHATPPVKDRHASGYDQLHLNQQEHPYYTTAYEFSDRPHLEYRHNHSPPSLLYTCSYGHPSVSYGLGLPQTWTPPQSMRGYWLCCQCQNPVCIATNSYECPIDGHGYCSPGGCILYA